MSFKIPPQVLNLMAKLVEDGERAMGIAEESEWLDNVDGREELENKMEEKIYWVTQI